MNMRPRSRNGATLAPIFVAIGVLSSIGVGGLALALWPEQHERAQRPEPAASNISGPRGTELSDSPRRPRTGQRFVWM
jgi:hypothetical protein